MIDKKNENQKTYSVDPVLLSVILMLLVFGLVMISSAGVIISKNRFDDPYFFFKHQLFFGVIPGIVALYLVSKIKYTFWKKIAVWLFILAITLLFLVFIPGFGMRLLGASRWLDLGPVSFQPSELAKLAIIVYLAVWLERRGERLKSFSQGLIPFVIVISIISVLIVLQPDVGTLGVISIISLAMFFSSGAPIRFVFTLIGSGLALLLALVKLEPYRMNRLLAFRNPEIDPQGIGYQVRQALIAVGSGGIFGLGVGQSRQKYNYLPEPLGDSIFAIIGEELGIFGGTILLSLFVVLAIRGFKIAKNAPDHFACFTAIGITVWIVFQAMINIMAIIGLIPLTGITLPFISYGSTSLIFVLIGVGILLNISRYCKIR